jgi:hypothetical protein
LRGSRLRERQNHEKAVKNKISFLEIFFFPGGRKDARAGQAAGVLPTADIRLGWPQSLRAGSGKAAPVQCGVPKSEREDPQC